MIRSRPLLVAVAVATLAPLPNAIAAVEINEFSTTGSAGFLDADDEASDSDELADPGSTPEALGGHFLTEIPSELTTGFGSAGPGGGIFGFFDAPREPAQEDRIIATVSMREPCDACRAIA